MSEKTLTQEDLENMGGEELEAHWAIYCQQLQALPPGVFQAAMMSLDAKSFRDGALDQLETCLALLRTKGLNEAADYLDELSTLPAETEEA